MSRRFVQVNSAAAMTARCSATAPINPTGELCEPAPEASEILLLVVLRLGDICHEPDMGKACGADHRHDFHDATVIDGSVAAHKDAMVVTVDGYCGELRHEFFFGDRRVLDIDLSVAADGDRQRFAVLAQRLRV